jgi:hypothetical protein
MSSSSADEVGIDEVMQEIREQQIVIRLSKGAGWTIDRSSSFAFLGLWRSNSCRDRPR